MEINYAEILKLMAPETLLVVAALAVLFVDMAAGGKEPAARLGTAVTIACAGCAVALIWILSEAPQAASVIGGHAAVVDALTQWVKAALIGLTLFTLLISTQSLFTRHVGEYVAMLLFATVALMFLVSAENLLAIFLALEFASLSLYVLAGFNKQTPESAEAALKYFLFGGMAAAFTLFGLSLIYGATGEIELGAIAGAMGTRAPEPFFWLALVMVAAGFGFKIAVAPFHLWAPDAYQGAPTPSAALIASGSKVASFFILAKVMHLGFAGLEGSAAWRGFAAGWAPMLAVMALVSMIFGNLGALAQFSVKRLLAYSAIAHAGYMLIGVVAMGHSGVPEGMLAPLLYYAATYAATTIGAFGVVGLVESREGRETLSSFAGFGKREPVMAFCMLIFMLSLAGIPPLAGFFGKFYLFTAAAGASPAGTEAGETVERLALLWLVAVGVVVSVISLYYYLRVLKEIYVRQPDEEAEPSPMNATLAGRIAIVGIALLVVVLGCAPGLVVDSILRALEAVPR